jgi:transposase
VVDAVDYDDELDEITVSCRLRQRGRRRCGRCGRRSSRYDSGEGRRRWRSLDAGTVRVFIEADAPRVRCAIHGVTVAAVPWARHGAGHTRAFDDQVAWLVTHTSKTAVVALMRIAWRTVAPSPPGWSPTPGQRGAPSTGSSGSGSMRSPTGAATST